MSSFRRFSRRAWLLHGYLIVALVLLPVPQANSYWTDSNGDRVKEWAEDPPQGDSWWDVDSDGDNLTNAQEALFGSDPYRIDADFDGLTDLVERDYADLTAPLDPWNWDSDGDGVSDHDAYYQYIQGYTPMVNYHNLGGVFHSYYDADGDGLHNQDDSDPANMDRDGDFILNWNDSYPDDPNNGYVPPTTDPGVWIGGMWYPTGTPDSDNDGTPDPSDPYPWGSFWYNGIEYGGTWSDRDGDGVPDAVDPFPDGSHWYNGMERSGPWVDQDGDNVPDSGDSWPTIAGSFWYNNAEYPGVWSDQDGDQIPDAADSFPNGSYWWNSVEYAGAWVDTDNDSIPDAHDAHPNGSFWYNGIEYAGNWSDADGDGVPDPADATPNGGYWYNGTEYAGVWSDQDIDGIPDPADATPNGSYWYNGTEYTGTWADSDGDSIPDAQDGWPTDAWNGEPHYGYNGSEYAGTWTDRDGDNVPDPADSWPDDSENGADSDGDGLSNYAERTEHGTDPGKVDSDDDFLTDYEELYAFHTSPLLPISDAAGGQTLLDGYVHLGADSDADGLPNRLEQHYAALGYLLDPANAADAAGDLDGDGYTNAQAYNFGWSLIANLSQYDYDGDRIPDAIEDSWSAMHPGVLDKTLFADAVADFDGDGLFNFEEVGLLLPLPDGGTRPADPGSAHTVHTTLTDGQIAAWQQAILSLPEASPLRSWADADLDGLPDGYVLAEYEFYFYSTACNGYDEDGDGMSDLWEYRHSFNLRDWEDWDDDPDGDTLGNWAEFQGGTHPRIADTDGDGFNDNLELSAGTNALLRSSTPASLPLVLYVSSGNYQSAQPGATLPEPLVVQATRGGVPWPGAAITFSAPAGSFGASTVITGMDGRASTTYTVDTVASAGVLALSAFSGQTSLAFTQMVVVSSNGGQGAGGSGSGAEEPDPNADSDNDGVANGQDAVWYDPNFNHAKSGMPHYAVIDLGLAEGGCIDMADNGTLLWRETPDNPMGISMLQMWSPAMTAAVDVPWNYISSGPDDSQGYAGLTAVTNEGLIIGGSRQIIPTQAGTPRYETRHFTLNATSGDIAWMPPIYPSDAGGYSDLFWEYAAPPLIGPGGKLFGSSIYEFWPSNNYNEGYYKVTQFSHTPTTPAFDGNVPHYENTPSLPVSPPGGTGYPGESVLIGTEYENDYNHCVVASGTGAVIITERNKHNVYKVAQYDNYQDPDDLGYWTYGTDWDAAGWPLAHPVYLENIRICKVVTASQSFVLDHVDTVTATNSTFVYFGGVSPAEQPWVSYNEDMYQKNTWNYLGKKAYLYRPNDTGTEYERAPIYASKEDYPANPIQSIGLVTAQKQALVRGAYDPNDPGEYVYSLWADGEVKAMSKLISGYADYTVWRIEDVSKDGMFAATAEKAGKRHMLLLLPVELYSDLNNDGQLTSADAGLVGKPYASGTSDEEKAKGTEYMFVNDQISNGAHDREDTSSDDPSEDDDDAKGVHIKVSLNTGKVWLDHPAIDALTFYKHKSCYPDEKLKLKEADPFDLEGTEQLPDTIYARCNETLNVPTDNPQSLGDLILNYLPKSGGQYVQMAKTRLVVVTEYGAEDFFQTANDYIMENNTKLYAGQKDYDNKPKDRVAVTVMRQEATKMKVLDTHNAVPNRLYGIREVVAATPDADVIINGNMTFDTVRYNGEGAVIVNGFTLHRYITKRCHGRLVSGSHLLPGYSDVPDSSVLVDGWPGSDLAGPNGKYLAMKSKGDFYFVKGRVPVDLSTGTPATGMTEAMGGLGTNYALNSEAGFVGSAKLPNEKKMLFTVTVMNPGYSSGLDSRIASDAEKGGVQKLHLASQPAGAIEAHELELFRTDGASSLALAVRQPGPAGTLKVTVEGDKHTGRWFENYVIHTYLSFTSDRPRGEIQ